MYIKERPKRKEEKNAEINYKIHLINKKNRSKGEDVLIPNSNKRHL